MIEFEGPARELKAVAHKANYFNLDDQDVAVLKRSATTIEKLLELYLELKYKEDKEPYRASTFYAGFTSGFKAESMAECPVAFQKFENTANVFDNIHVDEIRPDALPQYVNARAYAQKAGLSVPDDVWEALVRVLEEWPDVKEFDFISKLHDKWSFQFTQDGHLLKMVNTVGVGTPGIPEKARKAPKMKVSPTEYHQLKDKIQKRDKRILELERAIMDHKVGIKGKSLGTVTANNELWRYINE